MKTVPPPVSLHPLAVRCALIDSNGNRYEFKSVTAAGKHLGVCGSSITKALNGRVKTIKGHTAERI